MNRSAVRVFAALLLLMVVVAAARGVDPARALSTVLVVLGFVTALRWGGLVGVGAYAVTVMLIGAHLYA